MYPNIYRAVKSHVYACPSSHQKASEPTETSVRFRSCFTLVSTSVLSYHHTSAKPQSFLRDSSSTRC